MVLQGVQGQHCQQRHVQTLAHAYAAITSHTDPWVALNEFFHEWFDYSRIERATLIAEEVLPGGPLSCWTCPQPNSQRPNGIDAGGGRSSVPPLLTICARTAGWRLPRGWRILAMP